jgi:hypothetical protein
MNSPFRTKEGAFFKRFLPIALECCPGPMVYAEKDILSEELFSYPI